MTSTVHSGKSKQLLLETEIVLDENSVDENGSSRLIQK